MFMSVPVSFVILAKNEQHRIQECLGSIYGWADEIIIVDDESTDKTIEIAKQFTDKIFTRKMELEGKHRNFGASKTKNDYVMMMDSDERMTPELKKEIEGTRALPKEERKVAYWVPRKNYLGNYWLRHGGWFPAAHIKLYHKNFLTWKEIPQDVVHPGVEIKDGLYGSELKNSLIHYNFKNIEDFIAKLNRHTTLEAVKWHLMGKRFTLSMSLWKTFHRFFKRFVMKKGYKDGFYGFAAAVLSGFYQFAAYCKYRELKENGAYLEYIHKGSDQN